MTGVSGGTPVGYESTVRNCVFLKCGAAFNIRGGNFEIGDPNATDHNSVVVEDCEDGGWLAGAVGDHCRITHSTIRDQSGSGLMIEAMSGGVCIDNSTMDNCFTAGISSDPGYMPTSLSITDNTINNCGRAIVLFNLPPENVRDNQVRICINLDTQLHERGHPGAKRRRSPPQITNCPA
jgi:hypothetical protein